MKTKCTECGMAHEVGESQKNSQMFCLGCDSFFKVKGKPADPSKKNDDDKIFRESIQSLDVKEEENEESRIKTILKKIFGGRKKKLESKPEFEPDPPKMSEVNTEIKPSALIDDFLDHEMDFENEPEDVPAEYIDFLTVGLDISSSDLLENHAKNKANEAAPQKDQK